MIKANIDGNGRPTHYLLELACLIILIGRLALLAMQEEEEGDE